MPVLSPEQLDFVIESAILAPSADNQHRFELTSTGNLLSIHDTNAALPPQGSYRRVLALLSFGAIAENIAIAASRFEASTQVALLPDAGQTRLIARIQFRQEPPGLDPPPLWKSIPLRHTNRSLRFSGPALTGSERGQLEGAIGAFPGCRMAWLSPPASRQPILKLMHLAESERFCNRPFHNELFGAIRFEAGWRASPPEGLPPGALGIEAPLRPLFAMLRHWPVINTANRLGAHKMLGFRAAALPARLAPDLAALTVKSADNQSVFDAGRAMQRTWLGLTRLGRVVQPMPAAALYALPSACADGIPAALQQRLADGWKACFPHETPLMLLRIGRARAHRVVAGRPPMHRFRTG